MSRSWITGVIIVIAGVLAAVVASPIGAGLGAKSLPAIDFGTGTAVILVAFVEGIRAVRAWLDRSATLSWIIGGLIGSCGLVMAGSSMIAHAHDRSHSSWVVIGLVFALIGIAYQARAVDRRESRA